MQLSEAIAGTYTRKGKPENVGEVREGCKYLV